jgi:hypothetical protein
MMTVHPFPRARRNDEIVRIAGNLWSLDTHTAETRLLARLDLYGAEMTRLGISEPNRRRELASFEGAIRALLWNQMFRGAR